MVQALALAFYKKCTVLYGQHGTFFVGGHGNQQNNVALKMKEFSLLDQQFQRLKQRKTRVLRN